MTACQTSLPSGDASHGQTLMNEDVSQFEELSNSMWMGMCNQWVFFFDTRVMVM